LMNYPEYHKNRQQEVAGIARELKTISRELGLTVVALSQLSRSLKSERIKPPVLADLRESGDIEHSADVVLFLHNPEKQIDKISESNRIQGIVAKQRNGPCGMFDLIFDGPRVTFKDAAPKHLDDGEAKHWKNGALPDWAKNTEDDDDEL